jgi:2-amino-4-hydroxy-6-hydroxymethyldihydropteridine diphosphokinase
MILLGLGSNIGDREQQLQQALKRLTEHADICIVAISNIYETKPVGDSDQPDFLNMTAMVETSLTPIELLKRCLSVETDMGRVRTRRWGPRIIDVDLLIFNDITLETPELRLPHPEIVNRSFVLIPLNDIAPQLFLSNGRSVGELADACLASEQNEVLLWKKVRWNSGEKCFV